MGMFDTINYSADCGECGTPLNNFQSKSGSCELRLLEPGELYEEAGYMARFYAFCSNCHHQNVFRMKPITPVKVVRVEPDPKLGGSGND